MITELFAWVGEDETGDDGLKSLVTEFGVMPAVFATRRLGEHDYIVQQMIKIAIVLGKPMRLVRFTAPEVVRTIEAPTGRTL